MDNNLFVITKREIQQHVLLQQRPDGALVDVGGLVAEQLRVVHVLRDDIRDGRV